MRLIPLLGVIALLALGLFGYVESQQVITTTTTRVVTVPGTTYTTQTVVEGTTVVATVQMPGYTLVVEVKRPDQVCTVTFTAQPPPRVQTITGFTATLPGTTFVITVQQFATTFITARGGTALTTTDFTYVPVEMYGVTFPMILYGAIVERCNMVTDTEILRFILDSAPATIAFPEQVFSFEGTTLTYEYLETTILTTTFVETRTGTTYTDTTVAPATFYTTTQVVTPGTVLRTVVSPGTTITETITTVITLQQQTPPTTPTATPGPTTPATPTTPAQTQPTTPGITLPSLGG